jgi:hypothetical protein
MDTEHTESRDGKRILVDCGGCNGCGQADASGFPCQVCGGRGYTVHKKPLRDYEAAGARAFHRGDPIGVNPYRYGWPSHGWMLGWLDAQRQAEAVQAVGDKLARQ